jgi:hypothetical protein
MSLELRDFPIVWSNWRQRYRDRDERWDKVTKVVAGEYDVYDPDEQELLQASPNFIETAIGDTAESGSLMPSVRVTPHSDGPRIVAKAQKMERIAMSLMQSWGADLVIPETIYRLAQFGMGCWVIWPDFEQKIPILEMRDPRSVYPEPGHRAGDKVRRCIMGREVYFTQLDPAHQSRLRQWFMTRTDEEAKSIDRIDHNMKVVLIEWFDEHCYQEVALLSSPVRFSQTVEMIPVELEYIPNKLPSGNVPVILGGRISDEEWRGQFDQVLDLQRAHVRLAGLALDYADQSVYSDMYVSDLIGELSYGGGSFIELGPNGKIGRVPPAVSSLNVQQDLVALADGIHLGGRWPRSRPGEIDQSIASAKFLEASAGMMNTAIRTYHLILARMFAQALTVAMEVDAKFFPGRKRMAGVLRNQQFVDSYDGNDIDLANRIRIEYGLGLGRDPAQSAILAIQYAQNGYISNEFVQESIEGVTDVARERARIDAEKLKALIFTKLLQGVETGQTSDRALVEMLRARQEGTDIVELFEKYVVEPQEQVQQNSMQTGFGGMIPIGGAPPGMVAPPGGAPPAGPGGLTSPPVPGAPRPSELFARLNTRGAGAEMSATSMSGGGG